jgi:hypothetical protein
VTKALDVADIDEPRLPRHPGVELARPHAQDLAELRRLAHDQDRPLSLWLERSSTAGGAGASAWDDTEERRAMIHWLLLSLD